MNDEMISWEECREMFIKEIKYYFPNSNFYFKHEIENKYIKIKVGNYITEWFFLEKEYLFIMEIALISELCSIEEKISYE